MQFKAINIFFAENSHKYVYKKVLPPLPPPGYSPDTHINKSGF